MARKNQFHLPCVYGQRREPPPEENDAIVIALGRCIVLFFWSMSSWVLLFFRLITTSLKESERRRGDEQESKIEGEMLESQSWLHYEWRKESINQFSHFISLNYILYERIKKFQQQKNKFTFYLSSVK